MQLVRWGLGIPPLALPMRTTIPSPLAEQEAIVMSSANPSMGILVAFKYETLKAAGGKEDDRPVPDCQC